MGGRAVSLCEEGTRTAGGGVVRIEVSGFKSFAERLELPLMAGVTAVVGPNGTGKSNLVDAVRWALGEQRPRVLRAERMEELLFAGSERRRPAGMAECAITLANPQDRLGLGTAEVEVRRRLFRSGESAYLVNRRPVRLRDVDVVMRSAGLRSDGYGIVSQGRVDEVLRATASSRMRMVEEAAGIGALEAERARALAALGEGATERARLGARREELARRVAELAVQAARAVRDGQLGVQIRRLEMAMIERDRRRLLRRAETLVAEVAAMRSEKVALDHANARARAVTEALGASALALETIDGRLAARRDAAFGRVEAAKARWEAAKARGADGERASRESEAALARARHRAGEARAEAEQWAARLPELERQAAAAAAGARAAGGMGGAVSQADALANRLEAAETALEDARRAARAAKEAWHALEREASDVTERSQAQGRAVTDAESALAKAESKARAAMVRAQAVRERWLEAQAAARASAGRSGRGGGGELVVSAGRAGTLAGIHGMLGDLLVPFDGMEVAIDAALGGAIADVVVSGAEHAEAAVAFLRTHGARATFLPLDRLVVREGRRAPDWTGVVGVAADLVRFDVAVRVAVLHRLGGVWVVDSLKAALAVAQRTGQTQRLVTLEGDVIASGGAITGGAARPSRLGRNTPGQGADLTTMRGEAEEAQRAVTEAEKGRRLLQESLSRLRQEGLSWERRAAQVEVRLQAAAARADEATRVHAKAESDAAAARQACTAVPDQGPGGGALPPAPVRRDALLAAASTAAQALGEARGALRAAEAEAERASAEVQVLVGRVAAWKPPPEADNAGLEAAYEAQRRRLNGVTAAATAAARARRLAASLAAASRVWAERLSGTRLAAAEREEARQREASAATRAAEEAGERLVAAYGGGALAEAGHHIDSLRGEDAAWGDRAAALRRERGELGPVWSEAVAAHAVACERLQTLEGELEELEIGRRSLVGLAEQARRRMDRAVEETLERVRQGFSRAVAALLAGVGDLSVVGDDAEGDAQGVQLHIALPGKRRTALGALSGGERALGALAFLFGLLAVRPSALVLLDEVEAALDPANAARFARYLRAASDSQQFLVITHQRPTMEAAHALWGFTAQEAGVSHLVTVQLDGRPLPVDEGRAG